MDIDMLMKKRVLFILFKIIAKINERYPVA